MSKDKSAAREYAFQFLYQFLSSGKWPADGAARLDAALADFERSRSEGDGGMPYLAPDKRKFAEELIKGVLGSRTSLESALRPHMQMGTDKTHKVDMGVLMAAVWEMQNLDTPPKVVINEAVELAKRYGEKRSGAFVNAVLDAWSKAQGGAKK